MKKIIFLLITIFTFWTGLNNTFAETQISSSPEIYFTHYVKGDNINPERTLVFPNRSIFNTNQGKIYEMTLSGANLIEPSSTFGTYNSLYQNLYNHSACHSSYSSNITRYDDMTGSYTYYVFSVSGYNSTCGTSPIGYNLIYQIDNITGDYYIYFINNNSHLGWFGSTWSSTLKVVVINNDLVFYFNNTGKFFTPKVTDGTASLITSSGNAPDFINGVDVWRYNNTTPGSIIYSQYIYGNNDTLRSCSHTSNTYNVFAWSNYGLNSNHQSVVIPPYNSYSYGTSCILYYYLNDNVTYFAGFNSSLNRFFSSYYLPGQGFTNLPNNQYIYTLNYYDGYYSYVSLNPSIVYRYNFINVNLPIVSYGYYSLDDLKYTIYQKQGNSSNTYSSIESFNNINTPTLSGTTITGNSSNSIVNNNYNNPNINNQINITMTGGTSGSGGLTDEDKGFWTDMFGWFSELIGSQNNNTNKLVDAITGSGQSLSGTTIDTSGSGGAINSQTLGNLDVSGSGIINSTMGTSLNTIQVGDFGVGSCRMFGDNLQFLYYSNGQISPNVSFGDFDNMFLDGLSFLGEKMIGVLIAPLNNTFTLVTIITPFGSSNKDYCLFGNVVTYQPHKMFIGTQYHNKMLLIDYLILFAYGLFLGGTLMMMNGIATFTLGEKPQTTLTTTQENKNVNGKIIRSSSNKTTTKMKK